MSREHARHTQTRARSHTLAASRSVCVGVTAQSPCEYLIKVERDVRVEDLVDSWWRHRRRHCCRAAVECIHPFAMPLWVLYVQRGKKSLDRPFAKWCSIAADDDDPRRTRQRTVDTVRLFDNTVLYLSLFICFPSLSPSLSHTRRFSERCSSSFCNSTCLRPRDAATLDSHEGKDRPDVCVRVTRFIAFSGERVAEKKRLLACFEHRALLLLRPSVYKLPLARSMCWPSSWHSCFSLSLFLLPLLPIFLSPLPSPLRHANPPFNRISRSPSVLLVLSPFFPLSPPRCFRATNYGGYMGWGDILFVGARTHMPKWNRRRFVPDRYSRDSFYSSNGTYRTLRYHASSASDRSFTPCLPSTPPLTLDAFFRTRRVSIFSLSFSFFVERRIEPQRYKERPRCVEAPFTQSLPTYIFFHVLHFEILVSFPQCRGSS